MANQTRESGSIDHCGCSYGFQAWGPANQEELTAFAVDPAGHEGAMSGRVLGICANSYPHSDE